MPNFLQRGQAFLSRTMGVAAGVSVTYARTTGVGQFSVTLTARPGSNSATAQQVGETQKPRREDAERDYLIAVADLMTGAGVAFTPKVGDRITETINGVACVFEVTQPENEPAWRYSDATQVDARLHTKRVA